MDLGFPTNGYGIMLSAFYITFAGLGIPGVMLTRKIGPRWIIPGYMIGWGAMAMLNAACTNSAGVLVVRLCELIAETWRSCIETRLLTRIIVLGNQIRCYGDLSVLMSTHILLSRPACRQ